MSSPLELSLSGQGLAWSKIPAFANQVVAILARPDNSASPVALFARLYVSPAEPTGTALADLPTGSINLGTFVSAAGGPSIPFSLSPDGIGISGGGYLVAEFEDAGAAHAIFCYLK